MNFPELPGDTSTRNNGELHPISARSRIGYDGRRMRSPFPTAIEPMSLVATTNSKDD
jgi:hypothetical protein